MGRGWMNTNWVSTCSWATVLYLAFIFGVQSYMKDKEPFGLRTPLTAWSLSLAIFSIIGACRVWPEFLYTFSTQGLYQTVCVPSFLEEDHVTALWTWFFVLSKLPELVDTVFHCTQEAKAHFLTLVSPCDCALVCLVFLHRVHRHLPLVHGDELHRPRPHVQLLRSQGSQDPCAQDAGHGDHLLAVAADGVWVRRQHPCLVLQGKWQDLCSQRQQPLLVLLDVHQLLHPLCKVFLSCIFHNKSEASLQK